MKFGVVVFPGSNCDTDCQHVLKNVLQQSVRMLWHADPIPGDFDVLVLPGGFSYGDYLRTGAIARFSQAMRDVERHAERGGMVVGICNGFQILLEAGLLPGAMLPNRSLSFVCKFVHLKVANAKTSFTHRLTAGRALRIPIAHGEGNYFCDDDLKRRLWDQGQVVFQYCDPQGRLTDESNPNGSVDAIAGIVNDRGNVLGMMPHPERASESALGSEDGRGIWESILQWAHP